jgi:hypothetical protein
MSNYRCFPPSTVPPGASTTTTTVNGRTYSAAPGTTLDVVDVDARLLAANGWLSVAQVGPTSARPTHNNWVVGDMVKGMFFIDTTLGYAITWDGAAWRNPVTNAAV